jgi:DNA-binding NtrC family response regulator
MSEASLSASVLVVDDEPSMQHLLSGILSKQGYRLVMAANVAQARKAMEQTQFDLLILDRKLPDGDGVALLGELRAAGHDQPALVITGFPSVQTAIEALGNYACDYLCKPFEPEDLLAKVEAAIRNCSSLGENSYLWDCLRTRFGFDNVLSRAPVVEGCYVAAAKVAHSDVSVLVQGDTGTGKEYLARAIHYMSNRSDRPFVPVNCGAIPETLLESELFGHEKGAFTSATSQKPGLCEQADGGTLFLDEIAEMSMEMQVKLLRFVQDRSFTRLGGVKPQEVDVRIVAATNCNLQEAVEEGRFREDLYYRLNVVPLYLPPLRERPEDIALFADHFARRYVTESAAAGCSISPEAMLALQRYDWPGNLRELENAMRRAMLIADSGVIEPQHLMLGEAAAAPNYLQALRRPRHSDAGKRSDGSLQKSAEEADQHTQPLRALDEVERSHIMQVLSEVDSNKTQAAKILGIARKTLRAKMDKYAIPDDLSATSRELSTAKMVA